MAYVVASPGSCGEFIQGYMNGASFMVTCPVNRYAFAVSGKGVEKASLPLKAERALVETCRFLGVPEDLAAVRLVSRIPSGKGMASSTADISAVCQAAALAFGRRLLPRELAAIALSIEPSDATFFEGIVQFDYRKGSVIRELGHCPPMQILIYDCGGEIDTMAFNSRRDLVALQKENEQETRRAMELFTEGLRRQSLVLIGQAATISAKANQNILCKEQLPLFLEAGEASGGYGVIAAHSGTVLGLILDPAADAEAIQKQMDARCGGVLSFLDRVYLTNRGMRCRECEINECPV